MSIKEKNNCFRFYDIDKKTNKPIFRIGKKIILDKRIGSDSKYGIVYLSHFKSNNGNKFDNLNKFAVKITDKYIDNEIELKILKKLTNEVIKNKCPHFPINYGSLECIDSDIKSSSSYLSNNKIEFPKIINENKSLIIEINELASGDLSYYLTDIQDINKDNLNAITQILLSIMFFHNTTKSYHLDCHQGNFLFHKIKPGGYFHYNIYDVDYYLENKGYLWVIWDFSFAQLYTNNKKPINTDFEFFLDALNYYRKYFSNKDFLIFYKLYNNIANKYIINDYNYLYYIYKEILDYLIINVSSFTTVKPSNIINKTPYIIKGEKPSTELPKIKKDNLFDYFIKMIGNK